MPCAPQRFLANNRNAVRTAAAFTPSSVRPIPNNVAKVPGARKGKARVDLTGSYTGAAPATFDIEIVDTIVATSLSSQPIFSGAGSGSLVVSAGNVLVAQRFTLELWDPGKPTTYAGIDFEGVRIRARAIGAGGNAISMSIDASPLVYTTSSYSLLKDVKLGDGDPTSGLVGTGFDWDSKVISTDDVIPANAHRVSFGDDPTVYLNYKRFSDADWTYHLVPALKRDIPKGTPIKFVTGGRTVVVTDGITPETYPGIVTVFDLLSVLKATSVLVTVDGIVADDRTPTGQSARELSTRTDAHVEPSVGSGSAAATGFVNAFAGATAVTELVTATCFAVSANDYPLASLTNEYWQLKGSLSGDLGFLKTGVDYVHPDGRFGLRIPVRTPPGFGTPKGRFSVDAIELVDGRVDDPPICMKRMALGPAAVDQQITLTYRTRPSGDCACDKEKTPPLNAFCLGTLPTGDDLTAFKADTVERIRELFAWKQPTVESLTDLAEGTEADFVGEDSPVGSLNAIIADFLSTLESLDELDASTVRTPSAITVGTPTDFTVPALTSAPDEGTLVLIMGTGGADAAFLNGKVFALAAGSTTTHAKVDVDTTGKTITVSGTTRLVLIPARYAGFAQWDLAFADLKADVLSLIGARGHEVKATAMEALAEGDPVRLVADGDTWRAWKARDTTVTGLQLKIDGWADADIAAAATGVIKRAGTVTGLSALTAGTRYYYDAAGGWSVTVPAGAVSSPNGIALDATTLRFEQFSPDGEAGQDAPEPFPVDLYRAKLENVLAQAGLDPLGKSDASILDSGDGCWRDFKDSHWWTVKGSVGGEYGPAFTNRPYHSVRKASDKGGAYFRTKEFGFVVSVKCPAALRDGDQIVLLIGYAQWGSTYQVGDELTLPVIGAHGLLLSGGQNGSSVIRWYVNGSVDGPFPDYNFDLSAPAPYAYSSGGIVLGFDLVPAGVPWQKGDKFEFDVIGGHYHFRKNGGAYGSTVAIPSGPVALSDGLNVEFIPGVAPSFVTGDVYSFKALQPYAVANVQNPGSPLRWEWDPASGSTHSLVVDLGSAQTIGAPPNALHTIPSGASVTVEGGTTVGVYPWSESLAWAADVIFLEFAAAHSARYLRVTLTGAPSGGIGWLWAGAPLTQTLGSEQSFRLSYKIARGEAGIFQGGRTLGKARSGQVAWTEYALSEADLAGLDAFVSWSKDNNDEPFIFVPQVTRPAEAYLQRVVADDVELRDDASEYGADVSIPRRFSLTLPLQGVFR